ncbi:MAG: rRNA maturation RNase YbeY [Clostridiales bacterium]|jgi:probable rRNA maturation factor|nr:rRNA maturation RNase YbeY [Clostridiales bacterium]
MLVLFDFPNGYEEDLKRVYKAALKKLGQRDIFDVEVSNTAKNKMKKINRETRGKDAVTDVLSFPNLLIESFPVKKSAFKTDINPETGRLTLGEIVVCYDKIKEQAEEFGHSYKRECCYLFLHGLLHLFGFDHENDEDKRVMRTAEEEIMSAAGIGRE